MWSLSHSWDRAPKTLVISGVRGVRGTSFVVYNKAFLKGPEFMLMGWLLVGTPGELQLEGTTIWLEALNCQHQSHTPAPQEAPGRKEGLRDWVNHQWPRFNQSCQFNRISIKNPRQWHSESFWVGGCIYMPEGRYTPTPQDRDSYSRTLMDLTLCTSSSGCSSISFIISFIIKQ